MGNGQLVTAVIASVIAAVAALVNLLFSVLSQYRLDLRKTRRDILAPHIVELAEHSYAVIALTSAYLAASSASVRTERKEKAREAASALDKARRKARLFLGELTEAIHALVILPRLADHVISAPERAEHLIALATGLRIAVDECLREAFVRGRFPTIYEQERVRAEAQSLRVFFSESQAWSDENAG